MRQQTKSRTSWGPSVSTNSSVSPFRAWHCKRRNRANFQGITSLKPEHRCPSLVSLAKSLFLYPTLTFVSLLCCSQHDSTDKNKSKGRARRQINKMWHIRQNVVATASFDQIWLCLEEFIEASPRPLQKWHNANCNATKSSETRFKIQTLCLKTSSCISCISTQRNTECWWVSVDIIVVRSGL